MRLVAVVSALSLAAASAAPAQQVLLRLGGQPGQFNRYRTVVETFIRGGPMAAMGGDSTVPMRRATTYTTQTLIAVDADTLTYSTVTDSASIESPAMPQMAQRMAGAAAALQGQTVVQRMSPRGILYSVQTRPGAEAPGGMGGMGGMGGRGRGMGGGGETRTLFALPTDPVAVGATWSDSMTVSEGTTASTTLATFRLVRVENRGSVRVAVVSMNGTMASQLGPGGTMQMSLSGELLIDTTNRRLAGSTMTMTGTAQTPQGEMPMRIHVTQNLI